METKPAPLQLKCRKYLMELNGAGHVCDVEDKTFHALYKGCIHWASGRANKIEVKTQYPFTASFATQLLL